MHVHHVERRHWPREVVQGVLVVPERLHQLRLRLGLELGSGSGLDTFSRNIYYEISPQVTVTDSVMVPSQQGQLSLYPLVFPPPPCMSLRTEAGSSVLRLCVQLLVCH